MATTGRTLIKAHKRVTTSTGQITDQPAQFWLRETGDACTADRSAFASASAQLGFDTQLASSMPLPASGAHWGISACGPTLGLTILIDSADFVANATGPVGNDLLTLDISNETSVQYYNP